jgi:DNA-binding MarR family transcriptional regulator
MRTTPTATDPAIRHDAVEAVLSDLGRTVGSLRCAGSQRLVRLGISMTHFHVITLLRHHDAMPMGRLAEILDASMSSATGIIDRMEEHGLVERVRVPDDRRVVLVRPTQAGLDLVDDAELVKNDVMTGALERFTPEQLQRMAAAVADLREAIAAELASAPDRYAALTQCEHAHETHDHHEPHGSIRPGPGRPTHDRPASEAGAASPTTGPTGA